LSGILKSSASVAAILLLTISGAVMAQVAEDAAPPDPMASLDEIVWPGRQPGRAGSPPTWVSADGGPFFVRWRIPDLYFFFVLGSGEAADPERGDMQNSEQDVWFVTEILPLEGVLTRFLHRHWAARAEVGDLRQDIYVRVYESWLKRGPPQHTQAFLLTIARNLMIDRRRREQVVSIESVADLEAIRLDADLGGTERQMTARLELRRLQSAMDLLPPRCREVVRLRKIEQLSQKDVARRMGITEDTVERQVGKGVSLLADRLFGAGETAGNKADRQRRKHRGSV